MNKTTSHCGDRGVFPPQGPISTVAESCVVTLQILGMVRARLQNLRMCMLRVRLQIGNNSYKCEIMHTECGVHGCNNC